MTVPNSAPPDQPHPRDLHMDAAGWELWNYLVEWRKSARLGSTRWLGLFHEMQAEELISGYQHQRTDPIIEEVWEYVRQWRDKWQPTRVEYLWALQQVQNNELRAMGAAERTALDAANNQTGGT